MRWTLIVIMRCRHFGGRAAVGAAAVTTHQHSTDHLRVRPPHRLNAGGGVMTVTDRADAPNLGQCDIRHDLHHGSARWAGRCEPCGSTPERAVQPRANRSAATGLRRCRQHGLRSPPQDDLDPQRLPMPPPSWSATRAITPVRSPCSRNSKTIRTALPSSRSTDGCGPSRKRTEHGNGSPASARHGSRTGDGSVRSGEKDEKSPVTGDCHVGICRSPGVLFPWATRPAYFAAMQKTRNGSL